MTPPVGLWSVHTQKSLRGENINAENNLVSYVLQILSSTKVVQTSACGWSPTHAPVYKSVIWTINVFNFVRDWMRAFRIGLRIDGLSLKIARIEGLDDKLSRSRISKLGRITDQPRILARIQVSACLEVRILHPKRSSDHKEKRLKFTPLHHHHQPSLTRIYFTFKPWAPL